MKLYDKLEEDSMFNCNLIALMSKQNLQEGYVNHCPCDMICHVNNSHDNIYDLSSNNINIVIVFHHDLKMRK